MMTKNNQISIHSFVAEYFTYAAADGGGTKT